jgi:hypothetical protein
MESVRSDWWRRVVRTVVQMIASGALLAATEQFVKDIDPAYVPWVWIAYQALVTGAQNFAEDMGWIKALLKAPPSPGQNPAPDPQT